jgi:hypothetical protein
MMLSRQRALILFLAALYLVLYTLVYRDIVVTWYGYEGFQYVEPPAPYLWTARGGALVCALFLPSRLERPSQIAYWLIYFFVLVPIQFVPLYSHSLEWDDYMPFLVLSSCAFAGMGALMYRTPLARIPRLPANARVFWTTLFLIGFVLFAYFFSSAGFRPRLVGLDEVYDVRADFVATTARAGRLAAYAVSWEGNVIDSLLLAHGLVRRRWGLFALGMAGQMALYAITGFKSVLFSAVIFLCIYSAMRGRPEDFARRLMTGLLLLLSLALALEWGHLTTPQLASMVNRVLGVPGLLTGYYVDFFGHHPKAMLGDGLLRNVVEYRYPYDVPHLIGDVYLHNPQGSANANFWADGFANFGYGGVIGTTIVASLVFWVYDSIARDIDLRLAGLLLAVPTLEIANCGLQTTLVTHGLGLCVLLVLVYPIDRRHSHGVGGVGSLQALPTLH